MRRMREVSARSRCPCGTGRSYGQCCKQQVFKWVRDRHGELHQEVPLSDPARDALREYVSAVTSQFTNVFGRAPRRGERLDTESFFVSDGAFSDELARAMEEVGVDPASIYAFRKTGLWVTPANHGLASRAELVRWKEAVHEYEGGAARRQVRSERALEQLLREYLKYPHVLGKFLAEAVPPKSYRPRTVAFQVSYILFCATKATKTHKAISLLIGNELPEDLMALARSVYETYLHMIWALTRPIEAHVMTEARIGLLAGTHEFVVSPKGKIDRRTIVNKKNGKTVKVGVTTKELAGLSGLPEDVSLHEDLYSRLSQYVHPDYRAVLHYVGEDGFSVNESHGGMLAVAMAIAVHLMVADALLQSPIRLSRAAADLRRYVRRMKRPFLEVAAHAEVDTAGDATDVLLQRVSRVAQPWLRRPAGSGDRPTQ